MNEEEHKRKLDKEIKDYYKKHPFKLIRVMVVCIFVVLPMTMWEMWKERPRKNKIK